MSATITSWHHWLNCVDREEVSLHLLPGQPPMLREPGAVRNLCDTQISPGLVEAIVRSDTTASQRQELHAGGMVSVLIHCEHGTFHGSFVRCETGVHLSFRRVAAAPASSIEQQARQIGGYLAPMRQGVVLVCGETASDTHGLLENMTAWLAEQRTAHIVALDGSLSAATQCKHSVVHRLQSGDDENGFASNLQLAEFLQPDALILHEFDNVATFEAALRATENGTLVLAGMQAPDVAAAFEQLRALGGKRTLAKLAFTLQMVVLRKLNADAAPPCYEHDVLVNSQEIADIFLRSESFGLPE